MSDPRLLTPPEGVEYVRVTHQGLSQDINIDVKSLIHHHPQPHLSRIRELVESLNPHLSHNPTLQCTQLASQQGSIPHVLLASANMVNAISNVGHFHNVSFENQARR